MKGIIIDILKVLGYMILKTIGIIGGMAVAVLCADTLWLNNTGYINLDVGTPVIILIGIVGVIGFFVCVATTISLSVKE